MDPHAYDDETTPEAVGQRLSFIRRAHGLSQQDFAERALIRRNAWSNYEAGRSRIGVAAAGRVCAVYGVTMDYIYLGDASNLPYQLAHTIQGLTQLKRKSGG